MLNLRLTIIGNLYFYYINDYLYFCKIVCYYFKIRYMKLKNLFSLIALAIIVLLSSCATQNGNHKILETKISQKQYSDRYVVVLSMDGFRADYVDKAYTPNLDKMAKEGVSGALRPSYPTLTFPNHYSMATGLYPNNHGLVSNEFWDKKLGHYKIGKMVSVKNPKFYNGEPIWNTAAKQGMKSASFFWVGSETPVNGKHPDYWKPYNSKVSFETRADSVLMWLQKPIEERPHIIMWYLDEPDHVGHSYGPDAPRVAEMVTRCDRVVGYFRDKLSKLDIASKVDFIVVADHGMATYYKEKAVNTTDYVPEEWLEHSTGGPIAMLYPKAGLKEKTFEALKKMPNVEVYKKGNVPARLNFGSSDRIGDIVIKANIGTYIYTKKDAKTRTAGAHGYDNNRKEMFAIFRAVGPHFEKNKVLTEPVPNITIYPIICNILDLAPAKTDADDTLAKSLLINLDK